MVTKQIPNPRKMFNLVDDRHKKRGFWWAKPQVYGFTELVKIEYRSDRELWI